jgi:hypothetical protein
MRAGRRAAGRGEAEHLAWRDRRREVEKRLRHLDRRLGWRDAGRARRPGHDADQQRLARTPGALGQSFAVSPPLAMTLSGLPHLLRLAGADLNAVVAAGIERHLEYFDGNAADDMDGRRGGVSRVASAIATPSAAARAILCASTLAVMSVTPHGWFRTIRSCGAPWPPSLRRA